MAFHRLTRSHPRLSIAALVGVLSGWLVPANGWVEHVLIGWNTGVWLYLVLILCLTLGASTEKVRKVASIEDENAGLVLFTVSIAAIASLAAVILQLAPGPNLPMGLPPCNWPSLALPSPGHGCWSVPFSACIMPTCSTPPTRTRRCCVLPTMSVTPTIGTSTIFPSR